MDLHDLVKLTLQILISPVWAVIGTLCSIVSIPLSILLARQSLAPHQASKDENGSRLFLRDGYHRAFLVKDLDIIDPTNLNTYLLPILKKNRLTTTN